MDEKIIASLNEFKQDLIIQSVSTIVRKHITFGLSYILSHEKYYELKSEVAEFFHIHPNEVLIVGSAKLGFSIAPDKKYRPFNDVSDIDVAIISSNLFDTVWDQVFNYKIEVGYWEQEDKFKDYLFRGWIRPDKLPPAKSFKLGKDWWEFFRKLTSKGNYGSYNIRGGLYKSWSFLEKYQSICVKKCKDELE